MIPEQRRDFIYRYVHEKNAASFNELAELMSVSHMTVRRDIQLLEEEGKVPGRKNDQGLKHRRHWPRRLRSNHPVAFASIAVQQSRTNTRFVGTVASQCRPRNPLKLNGLRTRRAG